MHNIYGSCFFLFVFYLTIVPATDLQLDEESTRDWRAFLSFRFYWKIKITAGFSELKTCWKWQLQKGTVGSMVTMSSNFFFFLLVNFSIILLHFSSFFRLFSFVCKLPITFDACLNFSRQSFVNRFSLNSGWKRERGNYWGLSFFLLHHANDFFKCQGKHLYFAV